MVKLRREKWLVISIYHPQKQSIFPEQSYKDDSGFFADTYDK